jgi:hypothetical protein
VAAGYSGKPLAQKLGIRSGARLAVVDGPENYWDLRQRTPTSPASRKNSKVALPLGPEKDIASPPCTGYPDYRPARVAPHLTVVMPPLLGLAARVGDFGALAPMPVGAGASADGLGASVLPRRAAVSDS